MLKTIASGVQSEKTKISNRIGGKLGKCLLCGERVTKTDNYLTTAEGYTHRKCWNDWRPKGGE